MGVRERRREGGVLVLSRPFVHFYTYFSSDGSAALSTLVTVNHS